MLTRPLLLAMEESILHLGARGRPSRVSLNSSAVEPGPRPARLALKLDCCRVSSMVAPKSLPPPPPPPAPPGAFGAMGPRGGLVGGGPGGGAGELVFWGGGGGGGGRQAPPPPPTRARRRSFGSWARGGGL